jgi:glycosyl transferase family 2
MKGILPAPLTVVVLTDHDDQSLPHCLTSVPTWVQEIVVIGVGHTDQTRDLAKDYGAHLVESPFETHVPLWHWALEHLPWQHDWVLCLDADQRVTPELAAELHQLFTVEPSALTQVNGFYIKRRQVFRGKWIRHGGAYPHERLSVFRRHRTTIDPDDWVDPQVYVDGPVGRLQHDLMEDIGRESHLSRWIDNHTHAAGLQAIQELYDRGHDRQGRRHAVLREPPDQRTLWRQQL